MPLYAFSVQLSGAGNDRSIEVRAKKLAVIQLVITLHYG